MLEAMMSSEGRRRVVLAVVGLLVAALVLPVLVGMVSWSGPG
jgi:hypothetical protein